MIQKRGHTAQLYVPFFGDCHPALVFAPLFLAFVFSFVPLVSAAQVKKEDVLKKYEQVIVRSNQMVIYGYDLRDVTFKLRRATNALVAAQYEQADAMLDEIKNDLRVVGARGPEQFRQEKKLAWIEAFGDFIQQFAIFVVLSLILLRLRLVKSSLAKLRRDFHTVWKLTLLFAAVSILGATVGLIRYGQSSWAFVDLQAVLVGIGGLTGGVWVGIAAGLLNGLFRFVVAPNAMIYALIPVAVGTAAGSYRSWRHGRALRDGSIILVGFLVGLIHSLFMYIPIFRYISIGSFLGSVFLLSVAECLMVYLFFFLAWQISKEEKVKETERKLMQARLQFLQAQINPHFLFNTLNTIAAVCGEEGAKRTRDLIMQLSTFFRRITKRESDFVSLEDELEYIDAYLAIEQARFGDRLQVEKEIRLSQDGYRTSIPILALQPIVENAVKHGISKKPGGGKLILSAKEEDSKVIIEVKDTGVGMTEEVKQKLFQTRKTDYTSDSEHTGIGFSNIRERLARCYGQRFKMSVESAPDQGTTVRIELPSGNQMGNS